MHKKIDQEKKSQEIADLKAKYGVQDTPKNWCEATIFP